MLPGDAWGDLANLHNQMGTALRFDPRQHEDALNHLRKSCQYSIAVGQYFQAATTRANLAQMLAMMKRPAEAAAAAGQALSEFRAIGVNDGRSYSSPQSTESVWSANPRVIGELAPLQTEKGRSDGKPGTDETFPVRPQLNASKRIKGKKADLQGARKATQRAFSKKCPETAITLQTSSGSLDYAVACAPPALEMTEVRESPRVTSSRDVARKQESLPFPVPRKTTFVTKGLGRPQLFQKMHGKGGPAAALGRLATTKKGTGHVRCHP